jgi:hypothetical protein
LISIFSVFIRALQANNYTKGENDVYIPKSNEIERLRW